ncbi:hypothetical protein AB0299_21915, partial [Pseudarthrobacter sp. NPDC080037]|uniref:hypothetical protein n=1 Tax=Pseudarthrobacter sp. NPDC080037 TaxID=3155289 RepID=UPI0034503752
NSAMKRIQGTNRGNDKPLASQKSGKRGARVGNSWGKGYATSSPTANANGRFRGRSLCAKVLATGFAVVSYYVRRGVAAYTEFAHDYLNLVAGQ